MKKFTVEENKTALTTMQVLGLIAGLSDLDQILARLKGCINMTGECGRGGHHVWVSNAKNERILMITEREVKPMTAEELINAMKACYQAGKIENKVGVAGQSKT